MSRWRPKLRVSAEAKLVAQHFTKLLPAILRARQTARPLLSANWTPWLLSQRCIERRRALQRSRSAIMARGEVSELLTGNGGNTINSSTAFHPGQASLAAQNFNMPALSPTMTEGNIATWKIKEGTTDPDPPVPPMGGYEAIGLANRSTIYSEQNADLCRRFLLSRRCHPRDRNRQSANGC
jgi:hypothetical protein